MMSGFGRKAEAAFGKKGPVMDAIARRFGSDGTASRDRLNPNRNGSPLHSLKAYPDRTLAGTRDAPKAREAAKEPP